MLSILQLDTIGISFSGNCRGDIYDARLDGFDESTPYQIRSQGANS